MGTGGGGPLSATVRLAHMLPDGEATMNEGGSDDDEGRPKHRRYVRVEVPGLGRAYQTALVVSDMPRRWTFPGGAGEWFAHLRRHRVSKSTGVPGSGPYATRRRK